MSFASGVLFTVDAGVRVCVCACEEGGGVLMCEWVHKKTFRADAGLSLSFTCVYQTIFLVPDCRSSSNNLDQKLWLGAMETFKSDFRWDDGHALSFANWKPGHPSTCAVSTASPSKTHVCVDLGRRSMSLFTSDQTNQQDFAPLPATFVISIGVQNC